MGRKVSLVYNGANHMSGPWVGQTVSRSDLRHSSVLQLIQHFGQPLLVDLHQQHVIDLDG